MIKKKNVDPKHLAKEVLEINGLQIRTVESEVPDVEIIRSDSHITLRAKTDSDAKSSIRKASKVKTMHNSRGHRVVQKAFLKSIKKHRVGLTIEKVPIKYTEQYNLGKNADS